MSARITASDVQNCLRSALVALVEDITTSVASSETGSDPSTIRRHKTAGGWDDVEIAALIAYEFQERGSSSILNKLNALQATRPAGEAVALRTDLIDELAAAADVDGKIIDAVRGTPSARQLEQVEAAILKRQAKDAKVLADIAAQKQRTGGPR